MNYELELATQFLKPAPLFNKFILIWLVSWIITVIIFFKKPFMKGFSEIKKISV